jgi:ABC-type phosphate transport system ATPase subunit
LVTHNLRQGLDLSDRWLLLFRGRVVEQGASAGTDPRTLEQSYTRSPGNVS